MDVLKVNRDAVGAVAEALLSAFAGDPLVDYLFNRTGLDHGAEVAELFRVMLEARVALAMPCFMAVESSNTLGGVMGYNTERPKWEPQHVAQWRSLMQRVKGLEDRLNEYSSLAEQFEPKDPHFYLGTIGVREGCKGLGVGTKLLTRFCEVAVLDKKSAGIYLETASEPSLRFYLKNGFELVGQGVLGRSTVLWCIFRSSQSSAA
jgi:ribosomal protein S18 acetylase RimI-like enzyme